MKTKTANAPKKNTRSKGKVTGKRKPAAPAVVLEKDQARALVYKVYGGAQGRPLPRSKLLDTLLADERAVRAASAAGKGGLKICAEGDSWINILWPFSGWPKTLFDVIQEDYSTTDVGFPGDTFQDMLLDVDYQQPIQSGIFDVFIMSAGGNDVLGGGALADLLRWKQDGNGSTNPKDYINASLLDITLQVLQSGYEKIAREVGSWSPRTRMLVHGYDYPTPRRNGVWIGTPFETRGYSLTADKTLIAGILKFLVDEFYRMLGEVASSQDNVTVVDLRGVCDNRWYDELHPKEAASRDFAAKFIAEFPPMVA